MDKQAAIDFIYEKLDQNYSPDSIVDMLIAQVKAPREMLVKFVAQVETQYRAMHPVPPPSPLPQPAAATLPPWLQELETGVDIPPEQQSAEPAFAPPPQITTAQEAADFVNAGLDKDRPLQDIVANLAQLTGETYALAERFVLQTLSKRQRAHSLEPTPEVFSPTKKIAAFDDPDLTKYVLGELSRHRKRSDVVMSICERTGAEWSEAQRFVGKVAVEQRGLINARKNMLVIPFGIGTILLGVFLSISSANGFIYYMSALLDFEYTPLNLPSVTSLEYSPIAFGIGIVMIAGGAIGIFLGLRSQFD
jgi:hypothetical protein